jgi:glycosyltransferase involved in cell wall biosynthesis
VIPNGIDAERFHPDDAARAKWRRRLNIKSDAWVIGMVARVDPMKAYDTVVEAAGILSVARPEARFILAGAGADTSNPWLPGAIARRGLTDTVRLLGEVTDIETLYPAFDVASLSSAFGEGFPNAVAEAMACGVPCVATDVGDCGLIIGRTGRVVPPRDARALANAWLELLALPPTERAKLGEAARRRIVESYDTARLAEHTERILIQAAL